MSTWRSLIWIAISCVPSLTAAEYDLVLRGGRVLDGTGKPAFVSDVAVRDGRIVAVGNIVGAADSEIDVRGLVVSPGFIDVHTHAEDVFELPLAENFARMGVTTLVLGNCGSSRLDLGKYYADLVRTNISVNVASLIGHGTVRRQVMGGSFMRPPTETELEKMKGLIDRAMKDGALGMSTGLIYLPGTFAKTDELIDLAKVVGKYGGIYASHIRNESDKNIEALEEAVNIGRQAKVPVQISHIKLAGRAHWNRASGVLAFLDKARADGIRVTHDQYLYTASSTGLAQLVPDEARAGGVDEFKKALMDPVKKLAIVTEMKSRLKKHGNDDFSYAVIALWAVDPNLSGLNVAEAAKRRRGTASLNDQIELILEITASGGATAVFHGMNEEDLRVFLKHPQTMIASDSGVRKFGEGIPHPRGYGNNARLLGRYVADLKLLPIEEAIRKMSSLPAQTFQLKDRGQIKEGFAADLIVFDLEMVRDNATYEKPHAYATGFRHVFVNGVAVVRSDLHTKARPGNILRLERASP